MPSKNPARRLRDILENADAIARYTEGMELGAFTADAKTRDAVERCLERISEATRKLGEQAPRLVGDQPWPQITALGNRLRHDYDRIRAEIVGDRPKRSSVPANRVRTGGRPSDDERVSERIFRVTRPDVRVSRRPCSAGFNALLFASLGRFRPFLRSQR